MHFSTVTLTRLIFNTILKGFKKIKVEGFVWIVIIIINLIR